MIVNQGNLRDLTVAYSAAYAEGFREAPADWSVLASEVPSSTRENHYAWLGGFPKLREWIGDRALKQMAAYDYRIKNRKLESTVEVQRDDIDDDQYGVYIPAMKELGYAAKSHPNELVFPTLQAGFNSLCYDGQYYFDVDHPVGIEGNIASVSNVLLGTSTPWYLLCCNRALKPIIFQKRREYAFRAVTDLNDSRVFERDSFLWGVDARVNTGYGFWQQAVGATVDLTTASFQQAYQMLQSFKSDEGRPLALRPTHIVVPPTLRAAAKTIVREKDAYGGDNINANLVQVLDTPWLV